jgi:exodeoxyribonuclease VII large subunit
MELEFCGQKSDSDIWTVSELTSYIKNLLESDNTLFNQWVHGEVTDFKRAYSGHCYFKIKDQSSILPCVMFRGQAIRLNFDVKDGMKVLINGNITVYEKGGNYQFLVQEMKPDGIGEIFLKFLQLKETLYHKGYFSQDIKKSLPFIPSGIGVITSLKGAGLQDILKTVKKRFPPANIYVCPTVVQGEEAPDSIVRSFNLLNKCKFIDVIIIGRGGGSFEDLNCFNDERVADAIYMTQKPVISGVGHETDITICDMVADKRAETPTAAATMAVPSLNDLKYHMEQLRLRSANSLKQKVKNQRIRLESVKVDKINYYFKNLIGRRQQDLDFLWDKISRTITKRIDTHKTKLQILGEKLNTLNPFGVLERGYVILKREDSDNIISSIKNVQVDDKLELVFYDGTAKAYITERKEKYEESK